MNVLSLFDGISCGRVALERAGIKVDNYYASEVDKYAIKIAQKNFPDTIQLGNVMDWKNWNLPEINLIIAGFPCQAWSVAGKQGGFDDDRGQLGNTTCEILKHFQKVNPNVKFLFENVRMRKDNLKMFDNLFGVENMLINSSLVSAQNRARAYWFNWEAQQPKDKNIVLKDVIEDGLVDRDKSYCIDANYFKGTNLEQYLKKKRRQVVFKYSSSGRGNGVVQDRVNDTKKAGTLTATGYSKRSFTGVIEKQKIRKLTPVECERLQTLPDGYTEGISNTQRYKALGNGWTVDVIAHILKHINF